MMRLSVANICTLVCRSDTHCLSSVAYLIPFEIRIERKIKRQAASNTQTVWMWSIATTFRQIQIAADPAAVLQPAHVNPFFDWQHGIALIKTYNISYLHIFQLSIDFLIHRAYNWIDFPYKLTLMNYKYWDCAQNIDRIRHNVFPYPKYCSVWGVDNSGATQFGDQWCSIRRVLAVAKQRQQATVTTFF